MKHLAVLIYDCGCKYNADYSFTTFTTFTVRAENELERKLGQLKTTKPKGREYDQCTRTPPIEVLIFDERLKLTKHWKRQTS